MKKLTEDEKFGLMSRFTSNIWSYDPYEWIPCLNDTLEILDFEDRVIHDGDYDNPEWSNIQTIKSNKPLKGYK